MFEDRTTDARTYRYPEFGDLHVIELIGNGTFGDVYLVKHGEDTARFAMKEISCFVGMDEMQRRTTEQEVKLLRSLHHPCVVAYHGSFVTKHGSLCILMEHCEHGDVHDFLQNLRSSGQSLPGEHQVLEWLVHLTLALHALHSRNILHRDIKTHNLFLTGCVKTEHSSVLKLGDLGIARVLNPPDEFTTTQIGSPFYSSPEVVNGRPYAWKSDVWGLGCVVFELLTGTKAFEARDKNALAVKIVTGKHGPISSSCTKETRRLIKSMLSKTAARRPTLHSLLTTPVVRQRILPSLQPMSGHTACLKQVLCEQLQALGLDGHAHRFALPWSSGHFTSKETKQTETAEDTSKRSTSQENQTSARTAQRGLCEQVHQEASSAVGSIKNRRPWSPPNQQRQKPWRPPLLPVGSLQLLPSDAPVLTQRSDMNSGRKQALVDPRAQRYGAEPPVFTQRDSSQKRTDVTGHKRLGLPCSGGALSADRLHACTRPEQGQLSSVRSDKSGSLEPATAVCDPSSIGVDNDNAAGESHCARTKAKQSCPGFGHSSMPALNLKPLQQHHSLQQSFSSRFNSACASSFHEKQYCSARSSSSNHISGAIRAATSVPELPRVPSHFQDSINISQSCHAHDRPPSEVNRIRSTPSFENSMQVHLNSPGRLPTSNTLRNLLA